MLSPCVRPATTTGRVMQEGRALNLAFTFAIPLVSSQNISWHVHVGGLVTGAAIAAAYAYAPRKNRNAVQFGATVAVLLLFVLLIWWRTASLLSLFGVA